MTLPEPAAELLKRTHRILDEFLTPLTPGRTGWTLTGGTVLAARWKHRESTDLDLVVHPRTEIARLAKAQYALKVLEVTLSRQIGIEGRGFDHCTDATKGIVLWRVRSQQPTPARGWPDKT